MSESVTATLQDLESEIRKFVVETFLFGERGDLDVNASLLEEGVLDSTGMMELVSFAEEGYGIEVPDADVVPQNFGTIARLAAYLARRRGE